MIWYINQTKPNQKIEQLWLFCLYLLFSFFNQKSGVKVFILLYKEIALALGINSYYSKHKLMECQNIKVSLSY